MILWAISEVWVKSLKSWAELWTKKSSIKFKTTASPWYRVESYLSDFSLKLSLILQNHISWERCNCTADSAVKYVLVSQGTLVDECHRPKKRTSSLGFGSHWTVFGESHGSKSLRTMELGTLVHAKMDKFSEKLWMAFDPPAPFSGIYIANLSGRYIQFYQQRIWNDIFQIGNDFPSPLEFLRKFTHFGGDRRPL